MIGVEAGMEFPLPVCEQQSETKGPQKASGVLLCLQLSTSDKCHPLYRCCTLCDQDIHTFLGAFYTSVYREEMPAGS